MLVIILEDQLLSTQQGKLRCGRALSKLSSDQPDQYECQMGFRVANIE
jgi:hypothetical protein